jgi:cobalt-zinc-cadmium efflux system outer membrane protein
MRSSPGILHLALVYALTAVACAACARAASAQSTATRTISRTEAVSIALEHGTRSAVASAAARAAHAGVLSAREIANPTLSASYSKSTPLYHAIVSIPLDFLLRRSLQVNAALSASEAAEYRLAFELAMVELEVDTLYTRAAALAARAAISRENAVSADSLLDIARVRRDVGDASDLDVELARVNAGQALNAFATDSLAAVSALLDLQGALGMPAERVSVALDDTLAAPSSDSLSSLASLVGATGSAGVPLPVAAARLDLQAAERSLALERRSSWNGISLEAGVEADDPSGSEPGLLPTFGLSIPLPLFSRNRGAIAVATVERDRARVELDAARRESAMLLARARRDLAAAANRAARDRELVASANRVARLSLQAYAEGEYPIATVLEAQRNARDVLLQLIDDVAALQGTAAALRLYTSTALP